MQLQRGQANYLNALLLNLYLCLFRKCVALAKLQHFSGISGTVPDRLYKNVVQCCNSKPQTLFPEGGFKLFLPKVVAIPKNSCIFASALAT